MDGRINMDKTIDKPPIYKCRFCTSVIAKWDFENDYCLRCEKWKSDANDLDDSIRKYLFDRDKVE